MNMAIRPLLFAVIIPGVVLALQVAPNSPCSSVCVDSSTLDLSDPNSSNTVSSGIVCEDADFTSTSNGTKWTQCMTCLQSSTFVQGTESDQYWFLYNLRYIFDHCVFGFPSGADPELNPCTTDLACGPLRTGLEYGNLSTAGSEFGYCNADGGSVTGEFYDACHNCVSSSGTTQYIANTLVALEAGCQQKPNVTSILGLNGTVFSTDSITIVDPASLVVHSSASGNFSIGAIVGIAVGAVVVLLVIAGCVLIQCHKRKKRAAIGTRPRWGSVPKTHKRNSSFSFRCRNILASPISPRFFFHDDLPTVEEESKQYGSLDEMASSQVSGITGDDQPASDRYYIKSKPQSQRYAYEPAWSPQYAPPTFQSFAVHPGSVEEPVGQITPATSTPIDSKPKSQRYAYEPVWSPQFAPALSQSFAMTPGSVDEPAAKVGPDMSKKSFSQNISLDIDTTLVPPQPAHQSPKQDTFSMLLAMSGSQPSALPLRSTTYSATDLRSTASSPSQSPNGRSRAKMTTMSSQGSGYPGLKILNTTSPHLKQNCGWPSPRERMDGWIPPPPPPGPPKSPSSSMNYGRKGSTISLKKAKRESGSPVESRQIQVSFPAPPPK